MSYFNPSRPLYNLQTDNNPLKYAGQTATWHKFVSASAGVPAAGFGSAVYYTDFLITAVFGGGVAGAGGTVDANLTRQLAMGQQEAGMIRISTQEQLSKTDEIIWRGVRYRVDTDSQLSPLNGYWMSVIVRGDN